MNIQIRYLFFITLTTFCNLVGMSQLDKYKNNELFDTIRNITISKQKGNGDGIAYNGERIGYHNILGYSVHTIGSQKLYFDMTVKAIGCFNAKILEKIVLRHYLNNELFALSKNGYYDEDPLLEDFNHFSFEQYKTDLAADFVEKKLNISQDTFFEILQQKEINQKDINMLKFLKNDDLVVNLNEALRKSIQQKRWSNKYFNTVNQLLLDLGADPNVIFDKSENKYCLQEAWYAKTKLLRRILKDSNIKKDDKTLFKHLITDQKVFSIESIFDNGNIEGQTDLYNYATTLYILAHKAFETENSQDLERVRQHVINRYKQNFFNNLYNKIYNFPKTFFNKLSNLKNFFVKERPFSTLFGYIFGKRVQKK